MKTKHFGYGALVCAAAFCACMMAELSPQRCVGIGLLMIGVTRVWLWRVDNDEP